MNRLIIYGFVLIATIGCKSNQNNESANEIKKIESKILKNDSKKELSILPIHGELNQ